MFIIGYYENSDPNRTVVRTNIGAHNFESAKSMARDYQKHPAFSNRTVVVIDKGTGRGYRID